MRPEGKPKRSLTSRKPLRLEQVKNHTGSQSGLKDQTRSPANSSMRDETFERRIRWQVSILYIEAWGYWQIVFEGIKNAWKPSEFISILRAIILWLKAAYRKNEKHLFLSLPLRLSLLLVFSRGSWLKRREQFTMKLARGWKVLWENKYIFKQGKLSVNSKALRN